MGFPQQDAPKFIQQDVLNDHLLFDKVEDDDEKNDDDDDENGPVEIVDLPSYKMGIPHSFRNSLPEGKPSDDDDFQVCQLFDLQIFTTILPSMSRENIREG